MKCDQALRAETKPREITLIHNKSENLFFHMSPDKLNLSTLTELWQAEQIIGTIRMGLCKGEKTPSMGEMMKEAHRRYLINA